MTDFREGDLFATPIIRVQPQNRSIINKVKMFLLKIASELQYLVKNIATHSEDIKIAADWIFLTWNAHIPLVQVIAKTLFLLGLFNINIFTVFFLSLFCATFQNLSVENTSPIQNIKTTSRQITWVTLADISPACSCEVTFVYECRKNPLVRIW